MTSASNVGYQPAVAYQGGHVNNERPEPKTDNTQPRHAPAADTQHADNDSSHSDRGRRLDVRA